MRSVRGDATPSMLRAFSKTPDSERPPDLDVAAAGPSEPGPSQPPKPDRPATHVESVVDETGGWGGGGTAGDDEEEEEEMVETELLPIDPIGKGMSLKELMQAEVQAAPPASAPSVEDSVDQTINELMQEEEAAPPAEEQTWQVGQAAPPASAPSAADSVDATNAAE